MHTYFDYRNFRFEVIYYLKLPIIEMKTMALTIFKLCVFVSFIASNNYADSADSLEGIKSAKYVADDSVPMLKRGAIGSGRRLSIDSLALKPQLVERLDGSDYRDRSKIIATISFKFSLDFIERISFKNL